MGPGQGTRGRAWRPHVSIAYSNGTGPSEPFAEALAHVQAPKAKLVVTTVELIILNRDNKMYEWEVFEQVSLDA